MLSDKRGSLSSNRRKYLSIVDRFFNDCMVILVGGLGHMNFHPVAVFFSPNPFLGGVLRYDIEELQKNVGTVTVVCSR